MSKVITTEMFIERAKKVHGNFYGYDRAVYRGQNEKIIITCPIHGDFETTPVRHWGGCKCAKCQGVRPQMTTDEFICEAKRVHGDKYDYSKVDYKNAKEKVEVICPKHGSFWVTPNNHVSKKSGCPECSFRKKSLSNDEFIRKAETIHGKIYDYSKVKYVNALTRVEIICPIHGSFFTTPHIHLSKSKKGCPKCGRRLSKGELAMRKFVEKYVEVDANNRSILNGRELDIYVPSKNLAIEFNGLFWHSEKGNYNTIVEKCDDCEKLGMRLINIFEDEWKDKEQVVKSLILGILNELPVINASECEIRNVEASQANNFIEENSLKNVKNCEVNLGLFKRNKLVSLMAFDSSEIKVFCTKNKLKVENALEMLINEFEKNNNDNIEIKIDRRYEDVNDYIACGFEVLEKTDPNFFYFKGARGVKRFSEMDENNGWCKIYDCGDYHMILRRK